MSLYQLHRAVFDLVRSGEVGSGRATEFDPTRYELTDDERKAFENRDIGALYQMGLHPVLLNAFCRALGYGRDEYRKILQPFAVSEERTGRWRT